jgi:AmiR/NasT family two-component response regulator
MNMITQQPLKILIAEDQEFMNKMIQYQMEEIGHTVIGQAMNGRQAVELVEVLQPDVVLMDIEMPEMDGLEAAQLIEEKHPCPIVLLTSHDNPEMVRRASQLGVGAYLMKPPSAEDIERAMIMAVARFADLTELRRLNNELQKALDNVKVLTGLLPICANCKKIRDDKGYWEAVEGYFTKHSGVQFTHGICPDCTEKYFPELEPGTSKNAVT